MLTHFLQRPSVVDMLDKSTPRGCSIRLCQRRRRHSMRKNEEGNFVMWRHQFEIKHENKKKAGGYYFSIFRAVADADVEDAFVDTGQMWRPQRLLGIPCRPVSSQW